MKNKNIASKYLTEFFRLIVGISFLFSGFVKSVDPLGFAYKIQDYLISFDLVSLFPLALPFAVFMVVTELLIGLFLLLGIYKKQFSILVTLFMAFFLPLTLWIALKNPVADCGCFGDALVISNWATFYKNIFLTVGAVVLLLNHSLISPLLSSKTAGVAALYCLIFGFSFALYNTVKLPVFDFRPFKIGSNISQLMEMVPGSEDVVENVFIYEKDGVKKEFTEDDYPWDDSTWVYVDMNSKIVVKGTPPKIEDFHINLYSYDNEFDEYNIENDITEQVLEDDSYTFLMISYFLEDMSLKYLNKFVEADAYAGGNNLSFYVLTSSLKEEIAKWSSQHNHDFVFAEADERVLKTMIRSNPGLILLKDGVVVNKWDDSDIPDFSTKTIDSWDISKQTKINIWTKIVVILLLLVLPLIILRIIDLRIDKKKRYK